MPAQDKSVRVHLTNIAGAGAVQLVRSLLPALEHVDGYQIDEIYLPDRGDLAGYLCRSPGTRPSVYRRWLPNALSRVIECTLLGRRFDGVKPLLVLGDLPIRCKARQTVFVQTSHLLQSDSSGRACNGFKYRIARLLFRNNLSRVSRVIVQTETMKAGLVKTYPELENRVHVVAQPVPDWLLASEIRRTGRRHRASSRLELFYPAADYPHKNHRLLGEISEDAQDWPVGRITLTLPPGRNPNPGLSWVNCAGPLSPAAMLHHYGNADALVFLSLAESYGFPLLEAMWVGLPIVCPDLPYARILCGGEAIYFDPHSIESLRLSLLELQRRLAEGWWPDWTEQLQRIPRDWDQVAQAMLTIATASV